MRERIASSKNAPEWAMPLVSYRVIVDLISATTTKTGLTVRWERDPVLYPKGIVVSDAEMMAINLVRNELHTEWNYMIQPTDRAVDSWRGLTRPMASILVAGTTRSADLIWLDAPALA
jgi:hypothetical protein